jgi:hypothetical protein
MLSAPRVLALSVALLVSAPTIAAADKSPVGISLFDPVQFPGNSSSIEGIRLNLLYGYHQSVLGVDIGLVNRVADDFMGFQWLGLGWVNGRVVGVQWNYLANIAAKDMTGFQLGIVNLVGAATLGLQMGGVNISSGSAKGGQASFVNYAPRMEGLQFGLVNITDNLYGLQIGLVNIAKNGFFPVFPIFNFAF